MIDKVSKTMTYGGACLAGGCGYAGGGTIAPLHTMTLNDVGLMVGIVAAAIGVFVQLMRRRDERDTKRREDQYAANRERREQELHDAQLRRIEKGE